MQKLLEHTGATATMIVTRVLNLGGGDLRSPLDTQPETCCP